MSEAAFAAACAATPPHAEVTRITEVNAAEALQRLGRWRLSDSSRLFDGVGSALVHLRCKYGLVGDKGNALDALEAAYAEGVGMMLFLARDPALDLRRTEP